MSRGVLNLEKTDVYHGRIMQHILYKKDFEELKIKLIGEVKDKFFGAIIKLIFNR